MSLAVAPVPLRVARSLLVGHYLRTVHTASYAYGLLSDGEPVGVAVFAQPVRENVARSLWRDGGGTVENTQELTRFYTVDGLPANAGTWFLARAVARLPHGVEMLVAYSDPSTGRGHHGGLYQAASWLYTGQTRDREYYYEDADGNRVGKKRPWRVAREQGLLDGERPVDGERRVAAELGLVKVVGERKYRYVKARSRRARTMLALPVLPYPKPGRVPTRPLQ